MVFVSTRGKFPKENKEERKEKEKEKEKEKKKKRKKEKEKKKQTLRTVGPITTARLEASIKLCSLSFEISCNKRKSSKKRGFRGPAKLDNKILMYSLSLSKLSRRKG